MDVSRFLIYMVLLSCFTFAYSAYEYFMDKRHAAKRLSVISEEITKNSLEFLKRKYRVLAIVIIFLTVVITFTLDRQNTLNHEGLATAISFVLGAMCLVVISVLGVKLCSPADVADSARKSKSDAFDAAFLSSSQFGLIIIGVCLFCWCILLLLFSNFFMFDPSFSISCMIGFGFGASTVALFSKVGIGIFAKASDIAAEELALGTKKNLHDSPNNPLTIQNTIGDILVGVSGIGADLAESLICTAVACSLIGFVSFGINGALLPIAICAAGLISSIAAIVYVKLAPNKEKALRYGMIVSSIVLLLIAFPTVKYFLGINYLNAYLALFTGILASIVIAAVTEYYTSIKHNPTNDLAHLKSIPNIILTSLSQSYISIIIPVTVLSIVFSVSYFAAGFFGISLAAIGLLSSLPYLVSIGSFGAIADSAAALSSLAGLNDAKKATESVDWLGKSTTAISKVYCLFSAVVTTFALVSAIIIKSKIEFNPSLISGMLIGSAVPFLFSSLIIGSIERISSQMLHDAKHRQKIDLDTSAKMSIREMLAPGILALVLPIIIGMFFGLNTLVGLLFGAAISASCLGISMLHFGSSLDNAKSVNQSKEMFTADLIGDSLKDAVAPSLSILIKLMAITSLVFAVLFI